MSKLIYRAVGLNTRFTWGGINNLNYNILKRDPFSENNEYDLIYNGYAIKNPDTDNISFNITDICSNYLYPTDIFQDGLSFSSKTQQNNDHSLYYEAISGLNDTWVVNDFTNVGQFIVQDADNEQTMNRYEFLNHWDKDAIKMPNNTRNGDFWFNGKPDSATIWKNTGSIPLNQPINGRRYEKQFCFYSYYFSSFVNQVATNKIPYIKNVVMRGCDNICADTDMKKYYPTGIDNKFEWNIGDFTNQKPNCALYYTNAWGGWDSFAIEGKVERSSTFTHYDFKQYQDNDSFYLGNTQRLRTESVVKYKLSTGYLKDYQSLRFYKHLISSNKIYMHIFSGYQNNDYIYPVLINTSSIVEKTYLNQGRKHFVYEFEVILCNNNVRG